MQYQYMFDFFGCLVENLIECFLMEICLGYCEYFVLVMVLMLCFQGILVCFVIGYLGGEYNLFEGYYVVCQNNVYVWVEVYVFEFGWQIFDLMFLVGCLGEFECFLMLFVCQIYDWLQFCWDCYVISYGVDDQQCFFLWLVCFWFLFWEQDEVFDVLFVVFVSEVEIKELRGLVEFWIVSFGVFCLLVCWWWV